MAMKGLIGFIKDGQMKATYCHRVSYPEGLGSSVVEFCRLHSVTKMKELFDRMEMVEDESHLSTHQVQVYRNYLPAEVWHENLDWLTVLKYLDNPLKPLTDGYEWMVEYGSFIGSMRCRWIYIINLDSGNLEICINGLEKLGVESDINPKQYLSEEALIPASVGVFPINEIPENWLQSVRELRNGYPKE